MICQGCAKISERDRVRFNNGQKSPFKHPKNCGCACMHKPAEEWGKMFSTEEPNEEA